METNEYRNETTMAMGVLLCLWLKLDALLEYGMQHVSPFLIATCAVLLLAVAGRALWLALADRRRLCAIVRSLLKSTKTSVRPQLLAYAYDHTIAIS